MSRTAVLIICVSILTAGIVWSHWPESRAPLEPAPSPLPRAQGTSRATVAASVATAAPAPVVAPPPPVSESDQTTADEVAPPARSDYAARYRAEADVAIWYDDAGAALGLNEVEESALLRTLVAHRLQSVEARARPGDLYAAQRQELLALLGARRLAALDEYEKSISARMDIEEIVRSTGQTQPITAPKYRELLRAAIDAGAYYERARYTGVESREALLQQQLASMAQSDVKMLAVVRHVLGPAYDEVAERVLDERRAALERTLLERR